MPKVQSNEEFFDSLSKITKEQDGNPPQEPKEPEVPNDPPAEPNDPPTDPPADPVEPTEPKEPEKPTEPKEPSEPSEPKEPVEPDQPTEPKEEGIIDKWDEPTEPPTDPVEPPSVDIYQELSKDLGLDGLTKEQIQEALKPKEDAVITGIPDDLALIVNLAKSGVDYKEYLALKNTDYNSYDNRTLVEHSVKDALKDNDGNISPENQEKLDDYLEGLSEMDITVQGNQIRNQLSAAREVRVGQIESSVAGVGQNREAELKSSLDGFNEVSGFKVQPHQKSQLHKEISSGDAVAKLIYKPDGSYDYDKIVKLKFIADNFDKMLDYHKQRAKTQEKRTIIDNTANVDTGVKGTPPSPDTPKAKDGLDIFLEHYGYEK
jgi:hypothetical protein